MFNNKIFKDGARLNQAQFLEPLEILIKKNGKLQKMQGMMTHVFSRNLIHTNEKKQPRAIDSIYSLLKRREGGKPSRIFSMEPITHDHVPEKNRPSGGFTETEFKNLWTEMAQSSAYNDVIKEVRITRDTGDRHNAEPGYGQLNYYIIEVTFK